MFREFVAAQQRIKYEFERDTRIGYQAVRIYCETLNKKQMPKFESLMPGFLNQAPTLDQQKARFHALSAHIGVPVREVKPQGGDGASA